MEVCCNTRDGTQSSLWRCSNGDDQLWSKQSDEVRDDAGCEVFLMTYWKQQETCKEH